MHFKANASPILYNMPTLVKVQIEPNRCKFMTEHQTLRYNLIAPLNDFHGQKVLFPVNSVGVLRCFLLSLRS